MDMNFNINRHKTSAWSGLLPLFAALTVVLLLSSCFVREWVESGPSCFDLMQEANRSSNSQWYNKAREQLDVATACRQQERIKEGLEPLQYPNAFDYKHIDQAQGRYRDAIAVSIGDCFNTRGDASHEIDALCYLSTIYLEYGLIDRAETTLIEAKEKWDRLHALKPNVQHTGDLYSFVYCRHEGAYRMYIGEYEKAISLYRTQYERWSEHGWVTGVDQCRNELGVAYFHAGDYAMALKCFTDTLESGGQVPIPDSAALSHGSSYVGRIMEIQGDMDSAYKHFARGYAAMANEGRTSGYGRVERSIALCSIGGFFVRRGEWIKAVAALQKASSLRYETNTETHPNQADILRELAKVSVAENHLTSATTYANRSMAILDASVVPHHARIASHLVARNSITILSGNATTSSTTDTRLNAILQKPLGPFKLDFIDTCQFYETALTKAGHPEDAAIIRLLRLQQQDRR